MDKIKTNALKRSLTTKDLLIYGLVFMTPLAPATMYGTYLGPSGGMVALCCFIGMIAMLFTGKSYQIMSEKYPMAGSVYMYVQKSVSPILGFISGWAILLDYFLLPAIVIILGSSFANSLVPTIPSQVWVLMFIGFSTLINVIGVDIMSKCSWVLFLLQMVVIFIFLICVIRMLINGEIHFNTISIYNPKSFSLSGIFQTSGIVILSYLGFDAISTFSEEAINPKKTIGKAIILSILSIGIIFMLLTFFAGVAYPDYQQLNIETAFVDIVSYVGGKSFTIFTTVILVLANGIAANQASHAAVTRVLFAMGRDGVLPKQLGVVNKRFETPTNAVILVGIIITPIALFCPLDIISTLISFGALLGFILLNGSVIINFLIENKEVKKKIQKYLFLIILFLHLLV